MGQVKGWVRSALAVLVLSGAAVAMVQGASGHGPVKIAGDDPKIYTGG